MGYWGYAQVKSYVVKLTAQRDKPVRILSLKVLLHLCVLFIVGIFVKKQ
jgi:hypothetical protein